MLKMAPRLRFEAVEKEKAARWQEILDAGINDVPDFFEFLADRFSDRVCMTEIETGRSCTYAEMDVKANAVAAYAVAEGLRPGYRVALMMENRIDFFAATLGFAKAGLSTALLNTSLDGELLRAALTTAAPVASFASPLHEERLGSAGPAAGRFVPGLLEAGTRGERPARQLRAGGSLRSAFVYIYTSGTTGRSKAAVFSHKRFIGAGINWATHARFGAETRCYVPLPLYHGNGGVVALSSTLLGGGTVVLRERFSAHAFWNDIRAGNCDAVIYIGELWRYLANTHPHPLTSPLRTAMGNGLAADLWPVVRERFGVEQIIEHYGSTEMPGDAVINSYGRDGSCGYLPVEHPDYLIVRHDVATGDVIRDAHGFALPCGPDEPGELLLALDGGTYDGYLDATATDAKLCRHVREAGDTWWRSGDLLRRDREGFFTFVDRLGDTFRWNGENTATSEVEQVLLRCPGILEVNAYGVRVAGHDGRACMVSLQVTAGFDWARFSAIAALLPKHARPRFVRIGAAENEKTTTLKLKKQELATRGYAPGGSDEVYVLDLRNGEYGPLTGEMRDELRQGTLRL